jgi:hypothetical protein
VASTASDADGAFCLDLQGDGAFMVRADAEGSAAAVLGPLPLLAAAGRAGLEISVSGGGSLAGRVALPAGVAPEKTFVAVSRGDCFPKTTRLGADGTYRFEHLAAGVWHLEVRDEEIPPLPRRWYREDADEASSARWRCTITDGSTTTHDLTVASLSSCEVAGELRLDVAQATLWSASLCAPSGPWHTVDQAIVDPQGRFRLKARHGGAHEIVFSAKLGESHVELRDALFLKRGQSSWTRAVATGRLAGRLISSSEPTSGVLVDCRASAGDFVYHATALTEPDGSFFFPAVLAGEGVLECQGRTRPVEVTAGGQAIVELR